MVVDENEKVVGIISLSDLLQYVVLRPQGEGTQALRTAPVASEEAEAMPDTPDGLLSEASGSDPPVSETAVADPTTTDHALELPDLLSCATTLEEEPEDMVDFP